MNLHKKLPCVCGHEYASHITKCKVCFCEVYDANGHNPDIENVLCPECKLTHLEKIDNLYVCLLCHCYLSEAQIWELVG